MSGHEAEQIKTFEETEKAGQDASSTGSGLAGELSKQLDDFAGSKKYQINDSRDISGILQNFDNFDVGISEKAKAKAVGQLGENLTQMVTGELSHIREMMQRNNLDTKEVDAKIKEAAEKVEKVKPLHDAILNGDTQAVQKMLSQLKPEQVAQYTELLQKHFDRNGLGIVLDYADGQMIVSRTNGDRAVAISKDKTDVIGINNDGSYDFSRQYRRENAGQELQRMTESSLSNFLYPRWGGKAIDRISNSVIQYEKPLHKGR